MKKVKRGGRKKKFHSSALNGMDGTLGFARRRQASRAPVSEDAVAEARAGHAGRECYDDRVGVRGMEQLVRPDHDGSSLDSLSVGKPDTHCHYRARL